MQKPIVYGEISAFFEYKIQEMLVSINLKYWVWDKIIGPPKDWTSVH